MKNMQHNVSNVSSTSLGQSNLLITRYKLHTVELTAEKKERKKVKREQRRLRSLFYNFITGFPALEGLNKMRYINKNC